MVMRCPAQTKPKNSGGYALIEILLAFGISTIIIVAMVSLAVATVKASTTNKIYAEAGKIAQSQSERLKVKRDTMPWSGSSGFLDSVRDCSSGCYIDSVETIHTGNAVTGTGPSAVTYYFTTNITSDVAKEFTYTVVATWNVAGAAKVYKIEGLLSDWRSL